MRISLYVLAVSGLSALSAHAQTDIPFDKAHFPNGDGLKMALDHIQQGDKLANAGGASYTEALAHYEQAYSLNGDNAELNVKMGLCHLNGRFPHRCLAYFQKAAELKPSTPRIHFLLGYGHQLHAEWDKAMAEYKVHAAELTRTPDPEPLYNTTEQRMLECANGKTLQARPVRGQVSNMGPSINSEHADYGALVTADGQHLFFTSRRANTTGGKINKSTREYFEDIYACDRTGAAWSDPRPLPMPVNSVFNDASVGLFNDGRTMIVYRDERGNGDLFESRREGDGWSEPVSMGEMINSPGNETSAWFSYDRKQLYFVSDREGGLGGQDIWMSRWDGEASAWGEPENLGPQVNSADDEDGVFVHPDGRTIYFSSKGFNTMGGYDLFKSTRTDGRWTKAENLGWPVNSPGDDLFFVLTADGRTGFFSSVRPNGMGEDDLYRVDLLPAFAEETASAGGMGDPAAAKSGMNTVMLKGRVLNAGTDEAMEARIDLLDLTDGRLVASFEADAKTGEYLAVVPSGHDHAMHVYANGCLLHSEHIRTAGANNAVEQRVDVMMRPLSSGYSEVMRNIFFDGDGVELSRASLAELAALMELLRENPKLRVEIGSHTDNSAGDQRNEELSVARAKAVVDHLVNNGISPDRLESKGYGGSKPLMPNDSEEHRARNRRVEITVL